MFVGRRTSARPANLTDRNAVIALVRFETYVHAHLDWKPPEDWLGTQPYWLAECGRRVIGALACPPDPPDTAWLRLFAAVDDVPRGDVWQLLWPKVQIALVNAGVRLAAALSLDAWLGELCQAAGFVEAHGVVVLGRPRGALRGGLTSPVAIRAAGPADFGAVAAADLAAFAPPWQMSAAVLADAIHRADVITVAEAGSQIIGYQLTTPTQFGAHLARLAVLPAWQGHGIGTALVQHLVDYANRRGYRELTVNTQDSNAASLALYQRLGFTLTGARYPVYQLSLV
ncbi:MAG: GNAT family N-acetyltransferase [Anaerolineales bacterium]|nr:GNAT family N-acetyltransferase [Anaerolineales bacterium]